jgi:hypothetical protein
MGCVRWLLGLLRLLGWIAAYCMASCSDKQFVHTCLVHMCVQSRGLHVRLLFASAVELLAGSACVDAECVQLCSLCVRCCMKVLPSFVCCYGQSTSTLPFTAIVVGAVCACMHGAAWMYCKGPTTRRAAAAMHAVVLFVANTTWCIYTHHTIARGILQ